ncbi:unnamed protein product [Dovyalis caffra]|uniref:Non-specific lipid-transfer protein n=1 Tax=Dovyalis caffra TaxID=77055 RepID=A0AAV1S343_9ROSI|nr:unnamed protein product [Dovyalis caffra]
MASSRAPKLVYLVVCIMVLTASTTKAAIQCNQVVNTLTPCVPYVIGNGGLTQDCCNAIKGLNNAASNTPDRQGVCRCLKSTASQFGYNSRNVALAAGIPGKCGVNLPYKIDPSTDCASEADGSALLGALSKDAEGSTELYENKWLPLGQEAFCFLVPFLLGVLSTMFVASYYMPTSTMIKFLTEMMNVFDPEQGSN